MRRFFASRTAVASAALACIALLLISVNVLAGRYLGARVDLTADHLFTLSPGTLHTLAKIDEPITLHYYYSQRLGRRIPAYGVYAARIRELLEQYVAAAHGKLLLHIYDPQPFSRLEDRAVAAGLQAVPLDAQGDQVYFGLAGTNSTDDQQVIPFFSPDRARFLEYDLTRLIHDLAVPRKTVVGLISGLPLDGDLMARMRGIPSRPWAILAELRQLYSVQELSTKVATIPAGIDVLMVVVPRHLPEKTLFAIDQFVLKGGKALIFADPYSEFMAIHRGGSGGKTAAAMPQLFKAWGLKMLPGVVAGDRQDAQLVNLPSSGSVQPMRYVAWLDLHQKNLNRRDMVTGDLNHLTMASAGILEPLKNATTTIEPLITTSVDSARIPIAKIEGMPDLASLFANFKPDGKRYTVAAHITGIVNSAFPAGPPKSPVKGKAADKPAAPAPELQALKKSVKPINVIVVGDTDMLDDRFWVRHRNFFGRTGAVPITNNGDFVADAIEALAGGEDLIGLRSRGTSVRPFEVVNRIRDAAQARYSAEEHTLEEKLKASQDKLASLTQSDAADMPATLSAAQSKTIEQFRADMLQTRRQLRQVQAALRHNIQRLKALLEFFNIALIPILVALTAVILGIVRLRRRRRRAAEA